MAVKNGSTDYVKQIFIYFIDLFSTETVQFHPNHATVLFSFNHAYIIFAPFNPTFI